MTFEAPGLLWLLAALPVLVVLYVVAQRRRARFPVSFSNLSVLQSVAARRRSWRRHVPAALMLGALASLLVGTARPHATVQVPRDEATVVMILDVSGSMRAEDVEPTRIAAAQDAALTFVDVLPEDFQVGLVSFSDLPEILAQPTTDREFVEHAIDSLDAEGGTAIGDALTMGLGLDPGLRRAGGPAAPRPGKPLAAIVLLTDGFQTAGQIQPLDAARSAEEQGLPVFTVSLGTPEGVVELEGPNGFPQLQRVPPDPETLGAIAEITGGEFFEAPSEDDLRSIYESLGERLGFTSERREVSATFAAAGLLLVVLGVGLATAFGRRSP